MKKPLIILFLAALASCAQPTVPNNIPPQPPAPDPIPSTSQEPINLISPAAIEAQERGLDRQTILRLEREHRQYPSKIQAIKDEIASQPVNKSLEQTVRSILEPMITPPVDHSSERGNFLQGMHIQYFYCGGDACFIEVKCTSRDQATQLSGMLRRAVMNRRNGAFKDFGLGVLHIQDNVASIRIRPRKVVVVP